MINFSKLPELDALSNKLPSPLAVPVAQVGLQVENREWLKAFLAGMDAFFSGLKWMVFIGISDVFQKLEEEHKFARRKTLEKIYPRTGLRNPCFSESSFKHNACENSRDAMFSTSRTANGPI